MEAGRAGPRRLYSDEAPLVRRRPATQIRLDHQARAAPELGAIDLHVLDHALDVVAGLGEGDALDPVDRINVRIPRIAISFDPLLYAAAPRIVGDEREDVGAAIAFQHIAKL